MGNIFMVMIQLGLAGIAGALVLLMAYAEWTGKQSFLIVGLGMILSIVAIYILLDAKSAKARRRTARPAGKP